MNNPKIEKGAIIRAVVLFIALLNTIFVMFGQAILPIGEGEVENAVNTVYAAISAIAVIVAAAIAWWRDNDITKWARFNRKPKNK